MEGWRLIPRGTLAQTGSGQRCKPGLTVVQVCGGFSLSGPGSSRTEDDSLPSSSSAYPEITSDAERHRYKREFDGDLREYKRLCAQMDDINDQMNKLSRQLDTMDDSSPKYQVRSRRR